ncbi:MAG: ABC transporter permease [Chitinophagaceae bacterium]
MFKNYFKTAIRSLLRNKGYSLLNIMGLAIGMASTILILLWVGNELSTDRFYSKIDRLYVMNNRDKFSGQLNVWSSTPKIMGPTIKQDYPEVEDMSRVGRDANFLFTVGEKKITENGAYVDSTFFNLFDLPLLSGDTKAALTGINKVVLTQSFAKNLFGNENPIGKTVKIDSTDIFTVTGVLKDLPANSNFNFKYLMPWTYRKKLGGDDQYWGNNSTTTYVLLKQGVSVDNFNKKVRNITINHTKGNDNSTTQVFAFPYKDRYLYNKSENGRYVAGRLVTVRLFAVIAGLILLIACINFMNLSTARSEKRAKEVGMRKVVGARRGALIFQFITESIVIALISFIIALGIVVLVLPFFNTLVGKQLHIPFGSWIFWLYAVLFIIFTGLLAGSYPAFFLSSFSPIKVLKGTFRKANSKINPRSILVVVQFTFAIVLIISTLVITRQIHYVQSRDRGYNQDALVFSNMSGDIPKHYTSIRQELLNSGAITAITESQAPITQRYSDGWGFSWPGSQPEDAKLDFVRFATDAQFCKTLGTKLVQGRDIDIYQYPTDSSSVLLTETAVKQMRLSNPIGALIKGDGQDWRVVGVVKDFVIEDPTNKVAPMIIFGPHSWFTTIHYRLNPAKSVADNLKTIENIFKKYNPNFPFQYSFADAEYAAKFADIERTSKLTTLFSALTIFISCLGLFGLAAYMAEVRTKEIGVRKVLGASVGSITTLLSRDFLKLVIIALVIAIPIAWYIAYRWLQNYEYRTDMPIWAFVLAGVLSIVIAILTVGFLSLRAARANPTKSLRTE